MIERILTKNTPGELATAAAITVGTLLLSGVVVALARRRLRRAAETDTDVDDFLLNIMNGTRGWLLFFPAVYLGFRVLALPAEVMSFVRAVSSISLIAQAAVWGSEIVEFFLRRYRRRRIETDPSAITTIRAFRYAALAALWMIAVLVALDNLGIDITTLVTGLGIGGVAVALATQNILGDLFASLSIVVDKPFVVGDFIIVGSDMGTVEHIGLKTTRIRSLSGEQIVFSNGELLQSRIRNYKTMRERRVLFRFGVLYQTPVDKLERIAGMVRSIIERDPMLRFDRGHFHTFGDSSYDFEFVYYVLAAEYNTYMDAQQRLNLEIVRGFESEGVEFAYPTRTLHLYRTEAS